MIAIGVHTGDSRIYYYHGSKMIRRSMDHSYVQTLVDKGQITEEEANVHPQSNILMGCLGTEDDPPIDVHFIPQLRPGDVLMCCSDGVWHYFSPNELGTVLSTLTPREATEFLIDKARSRGNGGGDNLSLAIVKLEPLMPEVIKPLPMSLSSLPMTAAPTNAAPPPSPTKKR